jgi:DNA-binding MarR family transcriptional regulator
MARRRTAPDQTSVPATDIPEVYSRSVSFLLTATANEIVSSTSFLFLNLFGIGVIEQRIVSLLRIEPGVTITRVCRVSRMDKSVVSRALARLEAKAYVVSAGGGADGRRALWSLTPEGVTLGEALSAHLAKRQELLVSGFSPVEQAALVVLLQKVLGNVGLFSAYAAAEVAWCGAGVADDDAA